MISQGILGTLLGTVLGAILSFCITSYNQWQQSRKQRRIATMQVVSNLRCWMREMAWRIDQENLWVSSNGMDGTTYNDLPKFPFETSPEPISFLKPATAIRLLGLIHEKDAINIHVQWSLWAEEDIDDGQHAKLFLNVAALCKRMSLQVGWPDEVYFDRYKAMMNERLKEIVKAKTTAPVAMSLDAA
jgi:hypothetical protein